MDNKHREFAVPDLKPNSEYVISLRAYNNIGDGRPIYETVSKKKIEINNIQAFFKNVQIKFEKLSIQDVNVTFVTIMCRNDELGLTMSWVDWILTDLVLPDAWKLREWE